MGAEGGERDGRKNKNGSVYRVDREGGRGGEREMERRTRMVV